MMEARTEQYLQHHEKISANLIKFITGSKTFHDQEKIQVVNIRNERQAFYKLER